MSEKIKARDSRAVDPFEDADEQVKAWAKARQQEYETSTLIDRELGLAEPEIGGDLMVKASAVLRSRGIDPDDASQAELLAALRRVSP